MTKIPSVAERVESLQVTSKLETNEQYLERVQKIMQQDRLTLLTELREWAENYLKKVNKYAESCHEENLIMLAYDAHSREMAIEHFKARLDELIKSTSI